MNSCTKLCKYCSKEIPPSRRSDYCCANCRTAVSKGYKSIRPRGQKHDKCRWCGNDFVVENTRQQFCTKDCQKKMALSEKMDSVTVVNCFVCGTAIKTSATSVRKICSAGCRAKMAAIRREEVKLLRFGPPRTCRHCKKVFGHGGEYYMDFCSKHCRAEAQKEAKRRQGHERRARTRGASIERFSPTYILKRDNYVCQACGKKTKPKENPNHPLYPNVDHIVPLSMGGEHSKKNCRCVCSSCNSKKCNRTLNDQLLLFG